MGRDDASQAVAHCSVGIKLALGDSLPHPHSFFGPLTPRQWAILMYKHLDHHLRQFGV